ncbi:peptide chain release factor N(5)-glutamine methyltransferase [Bacillota bacterium LX-D]|nr:peptide chain release factor N(5)-glutamine methyltransferase [Bacillota bacterium LX-D]
MAINNEPPTVKTELSWAVPFLQKSSISSARLEAEVILAYVLSWDRVKLLTNLFSKIDSAKQQSFRKLVGQRATHYPLQYLLGRQEFMSIEFQVNPSVLIPRDDTGILVEEVLKLKGKTPLNSRIVDVGTGSGAIAVALKRFWTEAQVSAVDISAQALEVARENSARAGVKIDFVQGDLLQPFLKENSKFDIIVSNPPYIPTEQLPLLQPEVTYEPHLALDGGTDGLVFYRRLAEEAPKLLASGGWLAMEIGCEQSESVAKLLAGKFTNIQTFKDYAGLERVVLAKKSDFS